MANSGVGRVEMKKGSPLKSGRELIVGNLVTSILKSPIPRYNWTLTRAPDVMRFASFNFTGSVISREESLRREGLPGTLGSSFNSDGKVLSNVIKENSFV